LSTDPKGVNYEPVIVLPREIFQRVFDELGPVNRLVSSRTESNFVLYSFEGNSVTFVAEKS
jgi:hypothetical protein